jgi:WD40 repeat protein
LSFPDGKLEKTIPFGTSIPSPVTKGDFVLMRPIKGYDVGVVDLNSGQIVRANKLSAMDIYEDIAVSELGTGEIGLFGATAAPLARVKLPRGHLASVRVSAVSNDLQWLAMSEEARGAVWNLATGQRLYNLKTFKGAYFDGDGAYVDFPKQDKTERAIARLNLQQSGISLANKLGPGMFQQRGPVVFGWKKKHSDKSEEEEEEELNKQRFNRYRYEGKSLSWRDVFVAPEEHETMEVRDSRTGSILWTRTFDKRVPRLYANTEAGVVTYSWRLYMPGAKAEYEKLADPAKKKPSYKDGDYLVEVVDLMTGSVVGFTIIDTNDGVFTLNSILATRTWAVAKDSFGRTLVYSLKTGECTGKVFGSPGEIASDSNDLFIEEDSRHFTLFDAATMSKKTDFDFPFPVTELRLNNKGDRILAVTADQTTYLINNSQDGKAAELNAAK